MNHRHAKIAMMKSGKKKNRLRSLSSLGALGVLAVQPLARAQEKVNFTDHVLPIFRNECFNCHSADKKKGDLDLSTFTALMTGSSSGEIVVPGDPGASNLFGSITHSREPVMPPKKKLTDKEIETVRKWIEGGLLENSGSKAVTPKKAKLKRALDPSALGQLGQQVLPGPRPIEAVVYTPRPGPTLAMAQSPWSPVLAIGGQKQIVVYDTNTLKLTG
jgi:hypothetical protein